MARLALPVLVAFAMTLACRAPEKGSVSDAPTPGGVETASLSGRAPRATGGFASVLTFEPLAAGPTTARAGGEPPILDQFGTAFEPRVLVARKGERVTFRNSEDVLHNVHVKDRASGETVFNVATIPYGVYEHRFEVPGVYDVSCDTHPAMAAFLVVTDAPFAIVAAADGAFEMDAVPTGRYRVTVWNLDPERCLEREVSIEGPRSEIDLEPSR